MEKTKLELVVGVFVFIGLVCLGYLSIKLGKLELVGGSVYEVEAQFSSASGLKPGSTVEIAGVEVGRVRGITLIEDRAKVKLAVNNTVKLYTDTIASIKTRGIIGEKFLALSPGGGGDLLKPGDTIRDTESGLDLEELVSQYVHGKVTDNPMTKSSGRSPAREKLLKRVGSGGCGERLFQHPDRGGYMEIMRSALKS